MRYNLELSCITVYEYKDLLKKQNLLPSRRMLWQDIDKHFASIKAKGINNISELKKALSSPLKMEQFAKVTGISEEYLTILKREIGSLEQKPVPLSNFPGIDTSIISGLSSIGIKTSKDYYESHQPKTDELYCLCDLVRINGVGAVAAKAFFEAGYMSVARVAEADAADMLNKVTDVNLAKQYYKASLGVKDMQFCIDFASLLVKYAAD